ncbi:MAG: restriction endonuclease [Opitutaceae bacterium]|nr:restriction endonuclease [Opitutaceae bacterium]
MTSRATRRDDAKLEALLKLGMLLLVLIALGVGGLAGFPMVLVSLLILIAILAFVVGGCWLVLKSRFIPTKKAGICLVLVGGLTLFMWRALKAPEVWTPISAVVRSVKSPPCTVEIDYEYQVRNSAYRATRTKHWNSVAEAKRNAPSPIALYYYANDPRQTEDQAGNGLVRVQAKPVATRIREEGRDEATLTYGTGIFDSHSVTMTGGAAATVKPGDHVPLWLNPLNRTEISLSEQKTVGGRRWDLLSLGVAMEIGGLVCLFLRRGWRTAPPLTPAPAVPVMRVDEQLEKIDWYQFEKLVGRLLELQGWTVDRSGGARPDGGADLRAARDGTTAVVQCKHWRRALVSLPTVRELLGTKASAGFKADTAMLFALSDCTPDAMRFANENGIVVRGRSDLIRLVEDFGIGRFPELLSPEDKRCPKCESVMVLRQGQTPFWGCSRFPACRGTFEVA